MSAEYYLVRKEAVPEVLRKVVEVNKLLESGQQKTVQDAAAAVGISRSSYYKFKNDVEEFHESIAGTALSLSLDISDETGVLSGILKVIADAGANILTIHQSIPINGLANVSLSIQVPHMADRVREILDGLEAVHGVKKLRIMGRQGV